MQEMKNSNMVIAYRDLLIQNNTILMVRCDMMSGEADTELFQSICQKGFTRIEQCLSYIDLCTYIASLFLSL